MAGNQNKGSSPTGSAITIKNKTKLVVATEVVVVVVLVYVQMREVLINGLGHVKFLAENEFNISR